MRANKRKAAFLDSIPTASIENSNCTLAKRCKFNFHYFTRDGAGQDFKDWSTENLTELLNKLKNFSERSLKEWQHEKIGKGSNHVLEVYGTFPNNSEFMHPKAVPHQALWARFRLESDMRLIGFIIPDEFHGKKQSTSDYIFDCNTFYVVFLDEHHRFYLKNK